MLARVFPFKTNATPTDEYAFVGAPPFGSPYLKDIDSVHISVAFTWDIPVAERLAEEWKHVAPVSIGGPAVGTRGEDFVPGKYVKQGYVITSRGCSRKCWFCSVYKREGELRELPVTEGYNVLDDNILSTSEAHIKSVFSMLERQKVHHRPLFTGGLEAKILKPWHVTLLKKLRPERMYFAYDTPDDWEPLVSAMELFREADYFYRAVLHCYCLIGYPGDTFEKAEKRLSSVVHLGMYPMAMLYRDQKGHKAEDWGKFQRLWARPPIIYRRWKNGEI